MLTRDTGRRRTVKFFKDKSVGICDCLIDKSVIEFMTALDVSLHSVVLSRLFHLDIGSDKKDEETLE